MTASERQMNIMIDRNDGEVITLAGLNNTFVTPPPSAQRVALECLLGLSVARGSLKGLKSC